MPKSYYTSTTGTRSSGNTRSSGHSHRSRDWGKYWDEDHIRAVEVSLPSLPSPRSLPSSLSGSPDTLSSCIHISNIKLILKAQLNNRITNIDLFFHAFFKLFLFPRWGDPPPGRRGQRKKKQRVVVVRGR
jgi:hypothetical protein